MSYKGLPHVADFVFIEANAVLSSVGNGQKVSWGGGVIRFFFFSLSPNVVHPYKETNASYEL